MLHRLFTQKKKEEIKIWKPRHGWSDRTYECEKIFRELGETMRNMTYEQVQHIVRERTGVKCSPKVILRWRKKQGYSKMHPLKRLEAQREEGLI